MELTHCYLGFQLKGTVLTLFLCETLPKKSGQVVFPLRNSVLQSFNLFVVSSNSYYLISHFHTVSLRRDRVNFNRGGIISVLNIALFIRVL